MKINKALSIFLIVTVLLSYAAVATAQSPVGGTYYTKSNIWFERVNKIPSTWYHRGAMLPVGMKVKVTGFSGGRISFTDEESDVTYAIIHARKHSPIPFEKLFEVYFQDTDPLGEEGTFHSLSKMEQENVKKGKIVVGMSKDAVVMAYGRPPHHRTPTLQLDLWTYWIHRFERIDLVFREGKVAEITTRRGP